MDTPIDDDTEQVTEFSEPPTAHGLDFALTAVRQLDEADDGRATRYAVVHLALCRMVSVARASAWAGAGLAIVAVACGRLPAGERPEAGDAPPRIVAMERTRFGGQLVVLSENGDRAAQLTPPAGRPARDNSPAWSPDGRSLAFVS